MTYTPLYEIVVLVLVLLIFIFQNAISPPTQNAGLILYSSSFLPGWSACLPFPLPSQTAAVPTSMR